ncbi:putative ABC transport system substrate-binding protein [Bradyrhizobium sp. USDA 4449]
MQRRALIAGLGAASVWPHIARAQRSRLLPTVGILWHAGSEQEEALFLGEVRHGLQDLGYVEGKNIRLINTYAAERYDRFAENAAALVAQNVDLIVAVTRQAALAAQRATKSIPIVSVVVPDPVGSGLVASLAQPGGNITGFSNMGIDLAAKRVELLNEAVSGLKKVAVFVNPSDAGLAKLYVAQSKAAAERLKLEVQIIEIRQSQDLDSAFASIQPSGVTGIVINNDPMMLNAGAQIAENATQGRFPTMVFIGLMAKAGALISYGPNIPAIFRRSATYVDKILKGAQPAELPVEQPTDYDMVINLKTAESLGLTMPATLIGRADEVIE